MKKRYVVETTNKTEIRPEDEQSENAESFRDNLCSEIQLKGPQRQKQTQEHVRRSGQARLVYVKDINQRSLHSPFSSILVSVSVFVALSTAFHSINSPDNSPFSHSILPVLSSPYWSS